jgi:predicted dehydrogenase
MAGKSGMNYAPKGKVLHVVGEGKFRFAAVGLNHGHIYGMTSGLLDAGGELTWVWDPDPAKRKEFLEKHPQAIEAESEAQVLEDPDVHLVAGAAITSERCDLGCRVMDCGKDYLSDKAPFTTLEQVDRAREKVRATGRIWAVCYSERVQNEAAVYAGTLVKNDAIGRVVHVLGTGPHRLSPDTRPEWFYQKQKSGGILCDIGSHQIEQFLYYAGAENAEVTSSRIANYKYKERYPEFEDFGEASLLADNGATNYFRVDWFTPDGLGTWGDGRLFILGTEGYIELRKYIDVARSPEGDHVIMVNHEGEHHFEVSGKVGFPYFGELILDSLGRTDHAMSQAHTFKAAELCVRAEMMAKRIE